MIRRLLVAEDAPLGDSTAPLASCQVGLRLTALSLICACSVRLAGLNASGATMMRDFSTSSLQASTARTPGAVRALRGLASGKPERKGVGGSTHGYGSAAAEPIGGRRPVFVYADFLLPPRRLPRNGWRTLGQQARGCLAPRWRRRRRRRGASSTHVWRGLSVLLCSLYLPVCTFQACFHTDRVLMMYTHLITTLTVHSYRRAAGRRT